MEEFAKVGLSLKLYKGSTYRSYENAYTLFVKDTLYNEDVNCFTNALQEWWRERKSTLDLISLKIYVTLSCAVDQTTYPRYLQATKMLRLKLLPGTCTSTKGLPEIALNCFSAD